MSSKAKSGLPETHKSRSKVLPTPRRRRISDAKNTKGLALDSPKQSKQSPVALKGTDLRSQLSLLQDALNKANQHIAWMEIEETKSIKEMMEAQKVADATNEKLRDAMVAQKRAEEDSEIERLCAIEASKKKDEECQREMESVRNQHAADVDTLLSTSRELLHVQCELASAIDEKNQALSHADDATKIAEIHIEKNLVLSAEIIQIKNMLDSKLENETREKDRTLLQLKDEITVLTQELERAKGFEEKLLERDVSIEHLSMDLEQLQESLEEANQLERSASESLNSVIEQLEQRNNQLIEAESEMSILKDKAASLEMTVDKQMWELQEALHRVAEVEEEYQDMEKSAETLRSDLDALREEKSRVLSINLVSSSSVQSLLEETARLADELKISKEEEEKSKNAMESVASSLHEVSAESRDAKAKLVCIQIEHEKCESRMEDIRLFLKSTKENYERLLDGMKGERDDLAAAFEQSNRQYEYSKGEWEQKEVLLVDCLKRSEQEKCDLQKAKEGLEVLLEQSEERAYHAECQEAAQEKEHADGDGVRHSPSFSERNPKKKNPLLRKFLRMLKKKGGMKQTEQLR